MTVQEFPVQVFTSGVGAGGGGGGLTPTLATSTPITATAGNLYVVDVATIGAAITANLPALPTDGDQIAFCDGGGSDPNSPTGFGLHTLTINPDAAHDIQGVDPLELDKENEAVWLTFDATLNRWTIVSAAIGGSGSGAPTPMARGLASRAATQAATSGASIIWDTENIDTDNLIDVGGGTPEKVIIQTDGRYVITAQVRYDVATHAGTFSTAAIEVNGGAVAIQCNNENGVIDALNLSAVEDLVAADEIEVKLFHDDASVDIIAPSTISVIQIPEAEGGGGSGGGRETLTAARTYFVDTAGNDSNDGLTVGTPFLTIQKAIDTAATLDLSIYDVTIQLANGTYNVTTTNILKNYVGAGDIIIQGDTVTPSNVILTTSDGNSGFTFGGQHQSGTYIVRGFSFQTTRTSGFTSCVFQLAPGFLTVSDSEFTDHTGPGSAQLIRSQGYGTVTVGDNLTVSGGAQIFMVAESAGRIQTVNGTTTTLSGTPNFTFAFVNVGSVALLDSTGVTYSGSATGKRYDIINNGVCNTQGSGATYFPGNVAGTTATGGLYL